MLLFFLTVPSRIPYTASPFPSFPVVGNPSAAKLCGKKENRSKISTVFFYVASFDVFVQLWFLLESLV